MNNVHTPRYDVGSRARLVCISRRGRSTDRAISNNRHRAPATAIALSGRAGERKTGARRQGDPDTEPPLCPLPSIVVDARRRSRHSALSVLRELALEIELSERPFEQGCGGAKSAFRTKISNLTYFRLLEFNPIYSDGRQEASERM